VLPSKSLGYAGWVVPLSIYPLSMPGLFLLQLVGKKFAGPGDNRRYFALTEQKVAPLQRTAH